MYTLLFVLASDRDAVYVASQDGSRVTYDAASAYRFAKPLDAHDVARRAGHLHGAYGYTVEKVQP